MTDVYAQNVVRENEKVSGEDFWEGVPFRREFQRRCMRADFFACRGFDLYGFSRIKDSVG